MLYVCFFGIKNSLQTDNIKGHIKPLPVLLFNFFKHGKYRAQSRTDRLPSQRDEPVYDIFGVLRPEIYMKKERSPAEHHDSGLRIGTR